LVISRQKLITAIVKYNLFWAAFGSLIIALLSMVLMNRNIFLLKDIFFYCSIPLVLLIGKSKRYLFQISLVLALVVYIVAVTGIFFELKPWQIYNLRQILVPVLIIVFSSNLTLSERSRKRVIKYAYKLMTWVVILGICFLSVGLWEYIRLDSYFTLKGIPVDARGLSYMFYEPALNYRQRMVATFLDPISLGHAIAAVFIMGYYKINIRGQRRAILLIILFSGLILCFSKGALMQVVLALFLLNRNINVVTRFFIPGLVVLAVFMFLDIQGILIHIHGFISAITNLNILGHGLGLVGNYAKMFADNLDVYNLLKISDTFIGSVIGQLGLLGFVIWLAYFRPFLKKAILLKYNDVGGIIIVSQLAIAVLSENTLNFTSFIIPGIISGILLNHSRELSLKYYSHRLDTNTSADN